MTYSSYLKDNFDKPVEYYPYAVRGRICSLLLLIISIVSMLSCAFALKGLKARTSIYLISIYTVMLINFIGIFLGGAAAIGSIYGFNYLTSEECYQAEGTTRSSCVYFQGVQLTLTFWEANQDYGTLERCNSAHSNCDIMQIGGIFNLIFCFTLIIGRIAVIATGIQTLYRTDWGNSRPVTQADVAVALKRKFDEELEMPVLPDVYNQALKQARERAGGDNKGMYIVEETSNTNKNMRLLRGRSKVLFDSLLRLRSEGKIDLPPEIKIGTPGYDPENDEEAWKDAEALAKLLIASRIGEDDVDYSKDELLEVEAHLAAQFKMASDFSRKRKIEHSTA